MIPYPNIDPVLFELGPVKIHWYGLMYLFGILGAWWITKNRARSGRLAGWTEDQVADLTFYIALGVILGGRVGGVVFYHFEAFIDNPLMLFKIWEGGMSFHGGLLGVLFAIWLFARQTQRPFWMLVDIAAPVVPIGLGLGRLGNFINAELWGKPTDVPWAVVYNGVARHASQLYEFLLEGVVMFAVLMWFTRKPRKVRATSGWFAILYAVFRIFVEFYRLPDAHIGYTAGWITRGQILSLPLLAVGLWLLWSSRKQEQMT